MSRAPRKVTLDNALDVVEWLAGPQLNDVNLDAMRLVQMFGLVALTALARKERSAPLRITQSGASNAARFAYGVGMEDAIDNRTPASPGEAGRTVKVRRVLGFLEIEPAAHDIARLVVPDADDVEIRQTIYYVLVELLRNVVQHSQDGLGAVAAAQRMDSKGVARFFQVAVADTGVGIFAALRGKHPTLSNPRVALVKAIEPHISGTFEEGLTGSEQNAGMGLFFVSEMAKRTGGRLLIASRGATLSLHGRPQHGQHELEDVAGPGAGYPGTLVAFEMPVAGVASYRELITQITRLAEQRVPKRAVNRWLRYGEPSGDARRFLVAMTAENTAMAAEFAKATLRPLVLHREPVVLDFQHIPVSTQSYLHALLFEVLRLAWAVQSPVWVVNVDPAVKASLDLLESYALGVMPVRVAFM